MKPDSTPSPVASSRWHHLAIGVLACYWVAVFASTHIPRVPLPTHFNLFDKVCHFSAFALLTLLAHLAWATRRPGLDRLPWKELAITMLVIAGYGALDEITQPLVGRSCELLDWAADVAGIVFATLVFAAGWALAYRHLTRSHERASASSTPPCRL